MRLPTLAAVAFRLWTMVAHRFRSLFSTKSDACVCSCFRHTNDNYEMGCVRGS